MMNSNSTSLQLALALAVREKRKRQRAKVQQATADYAAWLHAHFARAVAAPFAPRHVALWAWFAAMQPGTKPPAYIACWPRGGGKSASVELGCVYVGMRQTRRFVLYVSATQAQADAHVQSIAGKLEALGIDRALNRYQQSKGWTQQLLRAANGFNVVSLGLDAAARGIKLDDYRPDLIVLDDCDARHDTPAAVSKKIATITESILPSGSSDAAVVFVQNKIHGNSIMAQVLDGRADFLQERMPPTAEPALLHFAYTTEPQPDGTARYVLSGEPTWAGQDLSVCTAQANEWGINAFQREAQHDTEREGRYFAAWHDALHTCDPFSIPNDWPLWAALDWGFAHPLAFGLFTMGTDGVVYQIAEHVQHKWLVPQHADAIKELVWSFHIPWDRVRTIVAGHDVFQQRGDSGGTTIAEQFDAQGIHLVPAQIGRISGAQVMLKRLGNADAHLPVTFRVFATCRRTIATIPAMVHDPARPEDVLKVNADADGSGGDDCYDMLRYALQEAEVFNGWDVNALKKLSSGRRV